MNTLIVNTTDSFGDYTAKQINGAARLGLAKLINPDGDELTIQQARSRKKKQVKIEGKWMDVPVGSTIEWE